jgi:DNA-binding NtrC family response regulator
MGIKANILAVDDDAAFLKQLSNQLEADFNVYTASQTPSFLEQIQNRQIDLVLMDMHMPQISGMELLKFIRARGLHHPVIMLTGETNTDAVVSAIQAGASDYVVKGPNFLESLTHRINLALKMGNLQKQNDLLTLKIKRETSRWDILGISPQTVRLKNEITKFKGVKASILITGENGTGKELIARNLNLQEEQSSRPFVAVNCGAISPHLFESELFGHKKGSFTGATEDKMGLFQLASGGDIFLDEIGELPLNLQVKLLRVLQEKVILPVGHTKPIAVDVRIIAATNQNLELMVKNKSFREDLYYRLGALRIFSPALRERNEDILFLAKQFAARRHPKTNFSAEAKDLLLKHSWPGNIRELQNAIERACIDAELGKRFTVEAKDLQIIPTIHNEDLIFLPDGLLPHCVEEINPQSFERAQNWLERIFLAKCLRITDDDNKRLLELLQLPRSSYYRMKKNLALKDQEAHTG